MIEFVWYVVTTREVWHAEWWIPRAFGPARTDTALPRRRRRAPLTAAPSDDAISKSLHSLLPQPRTAEARAHLEGISPVPPAENYLED